MNNNDLDIIIKLKDKLLISKINLLIYIYIV